MRNNTKNKRQKQRIVLEIIIAILILLLITSCSAIAYLGKIGKNTLEISTRIDDDTKHLPKNINDKLTFDMDNNELMKINLEDGNYKISYSAKGINPKDLTCVTSNAKIATCVVEDGYIRIIPKKKGTVKVELVSKTNGTRYIASTSIKIGDNKPTSNDVNNGGSNSNNQNSNSNSGTNNGKNNNSGNNSSNNQNNNSSNHNNNSGNNNSNSGNDNNSGNNGNNNPSTPDKPITKENDARLKTLKVGNYTLNPTFDKDTFQYVVTVKSDVDSVVISATTNSSKATIESGVGTITLDESSKTVKIKVKAEDGTTKTYTVKINKKASISDLSSDAKLKSLILAGYSLNPNFSSNTYEYNLKVPYDVTSIDVSAIPNVETSLVVISGNKDFKVGENTIKVKVTAEDGTLKTYKVNVERLSQSVVNTNAYLSSLTLGNATLNETFDKEKYLYTVDVDSNIDNLDITAIPELSSSVVSITGNENFTGGKNNVYIKVTSIDGIEKTYTIEVNKEDLASYYIDSLKTYKAGYKTSGDNYKNIIINSNILGDNVTSTYEGGTLTITDGKSRIVLESYGVTLSYIDDPNSSTSHTVKVSYNSTGNKTILVKGYYKDNLIDEYNINFNITGIFNVTIDANGGFFNEFSNKYELVFNEGEKLDLNDYKTAYKKTDEECMVYKLKNYNTKADGTGTPYSFDEITINNDLELYAIYDEENKIKYINTNNRLYLADVDIFTLADGTKGVIYPGAYGSYIMHIENTTNDKLTLKKLVIEEDSICPNSKCLNMGYIVKYTNDSMNGYRYVMGTSDNYTILNKVSSSKVDNHDGTFHNLVELDLDNIELDPNEETEISLLWKWVDDENDTTIGKLAASNNDPTYYSLTVSYIYDKDEITCEE